MAAVDPFLELLDRARAEAAARSRGATAALRRQAEESATFAGALLDLADGRTEVVVTTGAARTRRGFVALVASDFLALRSGRSATFVALGAVRTVAGGRGAPSGDRVVERDLRLADVAAVLAGERAAATLHLDGGTVVAGDVVAAGVDVVSIRPEDPPTRVVLVPVGAIAELVVGAGEVPEHL